MADANLDLANTELIEASRRVVSAQDAIAQAAGDHARAVVTLEAAVGAAEAEAARAAASAVALAGSLAASEAINLELRQHVLDLESEIDRLTEVLYPHSVYMGMATEYARWDERVALTGPVNARRVFSGSGWNTDGLMSRIVDAHEAGCLPYASMKYGSPASGQTMVDVWKRVIAGDYDNRARDLAARISDLGYPVRLAFHHEPRDTQVKTVQQLAFWAQAHTRMNRIVKDIAGDAVIVGPCDNGHPWGLRWGNLSDAELAVVYTPDFLSSCDALGGDFYDGATDKVGSGEPAAVKMQVFADWASRIEFDGLLDVGEWNFVDAEDCHAAWEVLNDPDNGFWLACLFNSSENNRADLPAVLGGSWELRSGTPRLAAFQAVLDEALDR